MSKASNFLKKVLSENKTYQMQQFKKYLGPIGKIRDDIISEAKKGKYCLEIEKNVDIEILKYFQQEGFNVQVMNDMTIIRWKMEDKN